MSACPYCHAEQSPRVLKVAYVEMCAACKTTWPSQETVDEYMRHIEEDARLDAARKVRDWYEGMRGGSAPDNLLMDDAALARIVGES